MKHAPVPPWMAARDLARACRVSERTARRWLSDGYMPAAHRLALDVKASGELGHIHPAWTGWVLQAGFLFAPGGARFTTGDVLAIPLRRQHLRALELAAEALRTQLRSLGQLPLFGGPPRLLAQQLHQQPAGGSADQHRQ